FPTTASHASAVEGLSRAPSGEIAVAGYFSGSLVTPSYASAGSNDGFVARLSAIDGSILTSFRFGDAGDERALAVVALSGGDVVVGGAAFSGPIDLGGIGVAFGGAVDGFVARFDTAGVGAYARAISTANDERITDLSAGPSGAIYVAGTYDTSTTIGSTVLSGGSPGLHISRIDAATGTASWTRGFTGGVATVGTHAPFAVGGSDAIRMVTSIGSVGGSAMFGSTPITGVDAHVLSIDGATGTVTRLEAFTGIQALGVGLLPSGEAFVSGWFGPSSVVVDGIGFNAVMSSIDQYLMRLTY
ncbi:MAG: hypothetical protein AB7P00_30645, partial [Sandaracinaceae bacterium]